MGNLNNVENRQSDEISITINSYNALKLGLVPGSSVIKIDKYTIATVPYRLGTDTAILLASFSRQEMAMFQRFGNSLAGLSISFQQPNSVHRTKIFGRCYVKSISPMRGRETIGLIMLSWKPCPPDLVTIIENYTLVLERLKAEYSDFKGRLIRLDPQNSEIMQFSSHATLTGEGWQARIACFAFSSDQLDFLVPIGGPELQLNTRTSVQLNFQNYNFSISGHISKNEKLPNGVQKASMALNFSPELVETIENFFYHERMNPIPQG